MLHFFEAFYLQVFFLVNYFSLILQRQLVSLFLPYIISHTRLFNNIISEWNKPAQKEYKARHNWQGKVISWELCKRLKFDNITKWFIHKPESFREKMSRIKFSEISNDNLSIHPDLKRKKELGHLVNFALPANHRMKRKKKKKRKERKKERKKTKNRQIIWYCWKTKKEKTENRRGMVVHIVVGAFVTVSEGLEK